ncbi:MAG: GtrA family protein [Firmicutes bacterium]|nr:GtrA family protein [Bacillota bacterium]
MSGIWKIIRFGLVGVVGFVADSLVLKGLLSVGVDLYIGQVVAYFLAASVTWAINRKFTFRTAKRASWREWVGYLGANALGGVLNYITFVICTKASVVFHDYPYLAVAVGSVVGMVVNYTLSLLFVFKGRSGSLDAPGQPPLRQDES